MNRPSARRPSANGTQTISCAFVGGPLDGRRLTVPSDLGSYHHGEGEACHVYYRRSHPSAFRDPDRDPPPVASPAFFDHQPQLTRGQGASRHHWPDTEQAQRDD